MAATLFVNAQRQTATLNYKISILWAMKLNTIPKKRSGFLRGSEQVKRTEILQVV